MGLANDNTYGNKKSNFNYQERSLRILNGILDNTTNINNFLNDAKSYSATMTFIPDATGASDVFQLSGAAGVIIKLRRIHFYTTKTVAGVVTVSLLVRSTLDSNMTSTPVIMKHDAMNPTSQAVVKYTTKEPLTLGTLVGDFRSDISPVVATGNFPYELIYDYGDNRQQLPTINSDPDYGFYLSLNGAAMVGGMVTIVVEWDEEA